LEAGGSVIVVLPDGLLKAGSSAKYRSFLLEGQLTLVSPNQPEAAFSVGAAMGRNRYVYCLADMAVVVASDRERGGTWAGAVENLKHRWVPLWVAPDDAPDSGLPMLVERGARVLADGDHPSLPRSAAPEAGLVVRESPVAGSEEAASQAALPPLYDSFLQHLYLLTSNIPADAKSVADQLGLVDGQARAWIRRALKEGLIASSGRPARYRWTGSTVEQSSLFPTEP
jgi:predicted Rossmann fold nucleotide-binding protein DprA/Smf involved in DNA uptake